MKMKLEDQVNSASGGRPDKNRKAIEVLEVIMFVN